MEQRKGQADHENSQKNFDERKLKADSDMETAMSEIERLVSMNGTQYLCSNDQPSIADFLLCSQCFEMI